MISTILAVAFLMTTSSTADEQTVDEIIEWHTAAMGGADKWAALKTYTLYQEREDGTRIVCHALKPDAFRFDIERDQWTKVKSFDGKEGFIVTNGQYEAMRPGEEIEMKEEAGFYDELLFAREHGYQLHRLGEEKIDEVNCHVIRMVKSESDTQTYWISQDDHLIKMTGEYSEDPAHAGIYYKTKFYDYRDVDGYLFPFKLVLLANDEERVTLPYARITVNDKIDRTFFSYFPEDTRGYFDYVKDQYASQKLSGFTFFQETIRYDEEGEVRDTSIWYETIQYPRNFRIDIGPDSLGHSNIWTNDSIYVYRSNQIVHEAKEMHPSLLLKNGFHHYETDEILRRLDSAGIDHRIFRKTEYNGVPAYVIGADEGDTDSPQVWLDARHNYILRRIEQSRGRKLEVRYDGYKQYDDYWIETFVDIFLDDRLIQKERYFDVRAGQEIDPSVFEIER